MPVVQPLIKCLHPKRQYNKYTNEWIITNCGKCKACLLHKASTMSLRCQLESLSKKYCMFVTLTYDNDNVPLATAVPYLKDVEKGSQKWAKDLPTKKEERVYLIDCSKREKLHQQQEDVVLSDVQMSHHRLELLKEKCNVNGKIPYLYHKDAQYFLKRFRRNLERGMRKYYQSRADFYFDLLPKCRTEQHRVNVFNKWLYYAGKEVEKIRSYCVGELGPIHFRPHFHLEVWFEEQETLAQFAESLRKSWSFGRIDWSMSRGKTSSYVASYLNSYCTLPKLYMSKEIRPKSSHSICLGEELFSCKGTNIFENDPRTINKRSFQINGTDTDICMWRTLKAKFFPICSGYNQKSRIERHFSYTTYEKIRRWTQEDSPFKQAKYLTELLVNDGFDYDFIPNYVRDVIEYFRISCLRLPKHVENIDYDTTFRVIYRELYISCRFIRMCHNVYTTDEILDKIERFYSTLDYENLKSQYEWQSEVLEADLMTLHTVMMTYNNSLSYYSCEKRDGYTSVKDWYLLQPLLMQYKTHVEERFDKSIKHKKLNDANRIFIN